MRLQLGAIEPAYHFDATADGFTALLAGLCIFLGVENDKTSYASYCVRGNNFYISGGALAQRDGWTGGSVEQVARQASQWLDSRIIPSVLSDASQPDYVKGFRMRSVKAIDGNPVLMVALALYRPR